MSSIQDMNNRMKQNRNLRPSKRAKFKEKNRETIFEPSNESEYLKIITNSGPNKEPDLNTHYLVVLAEKTVETE